jgi:hypothetical protein
MAVKTVIRFCKNIRKFCNEINKCAGWIFFLCRVEFSKIGKRDITFIREMRVKGQIISKKKFSGQGFFQKTNKNTSHTSKN